MNLLSELKPAPYYNYLQLCIELSFVPHKMILAGRGAGKTTLIANEVIKYLQVMPRGKYSLNGLTYFHLKTKSLPEIFCHLERRGLIRDQHYFFGHKSPKKLKWDEPYKPPLDYTNCLHFVNGFVVELNSFDRPEMARSGSYDGMAFDEVTQLKESAINSDVLPANRGNKEHFGHIGFHHGTLFLGTQPLTPDGDWVFKYEELMKKHPKKYQFIEASGYVNKSVLDKDYFRDLKRSLPQIVFELEIENKRRKQNVSGFYQGLSEKNGYYNSYDYSYYDEIDYDVNKQGGMDSRGDKDCLKQEPLYVSFDFGSAQNCLVVGQWNRLADEFPIIKNFYVENEVLSVLVKKFIEYYQHHANKTVYLFGGSDGQRKNDAASRETYFDDVIDQLSKAGWTCYNRAELYEAPHMDKFIFWNKYLSGDFHNVPDFRINMNNAKETYVSMDNAGVHPSEFKKDKSSERRKDQPRWKATDLSDAVDNLYYWLFNDSLGEQTSIPSMTIL